MSSDYQLGKDISNILRRLERLENDNCDCTESEGIYEHIENENDDEELLFSYSVYPMLQEKVHISIIVHKKDEMDRFFDNKTYADIVSFIREESESFTFYSTVISVEKLEAFENHVAEFLAKESEFAGRKYNHKCIFFRRRYIGGCGKKKVKRFCKTRSDAWNSCKDRGNSLCPRILERRGRC